MKVVLLDNSSFMHRSYHASKARPFYTKEGVPCAAVSLFRTMIERLKKDLKPDMLLAACDLGRESSFRSVLYPAYKATRSQNDPDFVVQVPGMLQVLHDEKIDAFSSPGFEADDIIGTLASHASMYADVVIVSGDKDMAQLVGQTVGFFNTGKNKLLDVDGVVKEYGVGPLQIVDLMALRGDSVDNVPGAPGIGEKGSLELIERYGNLENLHQHAGEIRNARYRHSLQENWPLIKLSQQLVRICCDVPISVPNFKSF